MWNEMLALQAPLFETILRAVLVCRSRYPDPFYGRARLTSAKSITLTPSKLVLTLKRASSQRRRLTSPN